MTAPRRLAYAGVVAIMRVLAALVVLAAPAVPRAATFVYLSSAGDGEPVLAGRRLRATPTDVYRYPDAGGGVAVFFRDDHGTRYWLYLVPPLGQRFAAGSYDGAADCGRTSRPGVCVVRELGASAVGGHIEVQEAMYDSAGTLIRFAAAFSQHTGAMGTELVGAVRLNAGDDACAAAPDGTPCDDLDACSSQAACQHGHCVPASSLACDDATPAPCRDPTVCDPLSGTCQPPRVWVDGSSCEPEDRCAIAGFCTDGVCRPDLDSQRTCSDDDWCTYDTCDTRAGCAYPPIPGGCGRPGLPGAFFFARRTPAEAPADMFLSTPTAGMTVRLDGAAVSVLALGTTGGHWSVRFEPPEGDTLAPGAYDDVVPYDFLRGPGQAVLEISGGRAFQCRQPASRFVVREFATGFLQGGRGQATAFSADFEQRCDEDGQRVVGSVRFRAGDPGCVGAADGTPCDDLDACTATSTCEGGACRGREPVVCQQTAGGCHARALCDPTTGSCTPPVFTDGTVCTDGSRCVSVGRCEAGVCTPTEPLCDDGNSCTADRCDAQGACAHDVAPDCWLVALRTRVTAQASGTLQGQSVQCGPLRCQRTGGGILLLPGDGTYRAVGGDLACTDDRTSRIPDEVGTVKTARGGRLRLRATNRTQIRDAIQTCIGKRVALSGRRWVQISADGRQLTGLDRSRFTIFDRLPLVQTTVTRLTAGLGEFPPPATLPPGARECPQPLRLRCVAR